MRPNTTKFVDLDGYFNQLMFSWYYLMGLCIEKYVSTFESEREIQQTQINETVADLNKRLEEYDSLIIDTKIEIRNNLLNLTILPENFKGYCIFIFQSLKQNFTYLRDVHWAITIKLKERHLYHLLNDENKQELVLLKDRSGFDFHEFEIGSRLDDFYVKACEAFEGYDFYPIVRDNIKFSRSSNYLSDELKENYEAHNTSQNEKLNKAHLVRGLFEIFTAMGANHDRTTVAKLSFFLINGKEAANKKEYQTLLNAISAENKQPNNETAKAEKETIKSYLQTLNLLKEK